MRKGAKFIINGINGKQLIGRILKEHLDGSREVEFEGELNFEYFGSLPLPPYIHETAVPGDRYQTVYAKKEGSIAAPTAGLHFTKKLLNRISEKGVLLEFVTLHVGWESRSLSVMMATTLAMPMWLFVQPQWGCLTPKSRRRRVGESRSSDGQRCWQS